jgi:hypothetical protein
MRIAIRKETTASAICDKCKKNIFGEAIRLVAGNHCIKFGSYIFCSLECGVEKSPTLKFFLSRADQLMNERNAKLVWFEAAEKVFWEENVGGDPKIYNFRSD